MAEHISMKQVPGGIVTATDDRILYDYLVNSGIVYGCEISYLGNNMIHINAGYGIIKGGLFEIEDHTEYVDYAESGAVNGQIYIHFDAAADDKIKIVKETSANPHQMIQNEDANFENGIYEIQLCTFRATTTALTLVRQTFVKSVMPIDVLDTLEAIEANTEANKAAGALALKVLNSRSPFRFGIDSNGNYGYIKDGADSVTPFSSGFRLDILTPTNLTANNGKVLSDGTFLQDRYDWKAFASGNSDFNSWLANDFVANKTYIGYNFGKNVTLSAIRFLNRNEANPRIIDTFKLQVSNDLIDWKNVLLYPNIIGFYTYTTINLQPNIIVSNSSRIANESCFALLEEPVICKAFRLLPQTASDGSDFVGVGNLIAYGKQD